MSRTFNLAEQLAELSIATDASPLAGVRQMHVGLWKEFILKDARHQLMARHIKVKRFNPVNTMLELVLKSIEDRVEVGEVSKEEHARLEEFRKLSLDMNCDEEFIHLLDDFIDENYYEISNEISEFVNAVTRKGDLWSCTLVGNNLIFNYCCNRADVEASIRASGGDYPQFVAHLLG